MSRFAADVGELALADYQRTVRLLLRNPLVTASWPDDKALRRVRRFARTLRADLADAFGYRLELHDTAARLVRVHDDLDASRPARTRARRAFDRQRYGYLALCLAVLGRAGAQITLGELAESVAADANRIAGLGLDADRGGDRRAFVDAVGWLEERGALRVSDGSAEAWASDPRVGEALYDISRDVVFAAYRPTRALQHVSGVGALLVRESGGSGSGNERRRLAAQRARRAVAQRPVVYFDEVDPDTANHLRGPALAGDLRRLTGLAVERRAEGVLLVDTANLSPDRFPGTGSVAQVAVLLAVAMADRVVDPDGRRARRIPAPDPADAADALLAAVDAGLPRAGMVALDGQQSVDADRPAGPGQDPPRLPFMADSFLRTEVADILDRYRSAFGAKWHHDPDRLRTEAVDLLARFGCVRRVPGGVLVLALTGRYRNTVARVSDRGGGTLF